MEPIEYLLLIFLSTIVNLVITYSIVKLYIYRLKIQPLITMAKRGLSIMGQQGQIVQHDRRTQTLQISARKKVMSGAIQELPFGDKINKIIKDQGISQEELFALMQDQNFIKGLMVIGNTIGGITGFIKEKVTGEKKLDENQGIMYGT